MGKSLLVSVITIFFNEEDFINEAVESVLCQSLDNWELLLVDDGSTDGSTEIAQQYARRFPTKVRYLQHDEHQNLGMSASRNLGIRNANGQFISFLDADDVWHPSKLEQQTSILEAYPEAGLVCGCALWWYSWTGKQEDSERDFIQRLDVKLNSVVAAPTLLIRFLEDEWSSLCDVLLRREILETVGAYENSFRGMYEDQVFHAKLCLSFPIYASSECWYRYRQHPEACTVVSNKAGQYYENRQAFLSWLEKYLTNKAMEETEVWKVLRKEQWHLRHLFLSSILRRMRRLSTRLEHFLKHIGEAKRCLA
jgi:glycosyltransferase involved in cell wall biosynthesis